MNEAIINIKEYIRKIKKKTERSVKSNSATWNRISETLCKTMIICRKNFKEVNAVVGKELSGRPSFGIAEYNENNQLRKLRKYEKDSWNLYFLIGKQIRIMLAFK